MGAIGANFNLSPGVMKVVPRWSRVPEIPLMVRACDGIPATGSSACREIRCAFSRRIPRAPSRKMWWSVWTVAGIVKTVPFVSETNDPPTTNAASAFCAIANVETHNMTNKIEKRFIRKLLLLDLSFSWLWHREMQIHGPAEQKNAPRGNHPGNQRSSPAGSNFSIKLENHIDFESLFMETSVSPNQPSAACCMNQPPRKGRDGSFRTDLRRAALAANESSPVRRTAL